MPKNNFPDIDDIRYVVGKRTQIIILPGGADITEEKAMEECRVLAENPGRKVRLLYHNQPTVTVEPPEN